MHEVHGALVYLKTALGIADLLAPLECIGRRETTDDGLSRIAR